MKGDSVLSSIREGSPPHPSISLVDVQVKLALLASSSGRGYIGKVLVGSWPIKEKGVLMHGRNLTWDDRGC